MRIMDVAQGYPIRKISGSREKERAERQRSHIIIACGRAKVRGGNNHSALYYCAFLPLQKTSSAARSIRATSNRDCSRADVISDCPLHSKLRLSRRVYVFRILLHFHFHRFQIPNIQTSKSRTLLSRINERVQTERVFLEGSSSSEYLRSQLGGLLVRIFLRIG